MIYLRNTVKCIIQSREIQYISVHPANKIAVWNKYSRNNRISTLGTTQGFALVGQLLSQFGPEKTCCTGNKDHIPPNPLKGEKFKMVNDKCKTINGLTSLLLNIKFIIRY